MENPEQVHGRPTVEVGLKLKFGCLARDGEAGCEPGGGLFDYSYVYTLLAAPHHEKLFWTDPLALFQRQF